MWWSSHWPGGDWGIPYGHFPSQRIVGHPVEEKT